MDNQNVLTEQQVGAFAPAANDEISVIGGADGPTAILTTSSVWRRMWPMP